MNSVLQDILGLIKRKKTKTPQDSDYIVSASYDNPQESLKPNPTMHPAVISLKAIKNWILTAISTLGSKSLGQGWARYDDTFWTESNKFPLLDGASVEIPNNAGAIYTSGSDIEYYNGTSNRVLADNINDVYIMTVVFKYQAPNANQTHLDIALEGVNGTPYDRITGEAIFPKGNDTEHNFHQVFQYYADSSFVENGSFWQITANGGDALIWDVIYFIQKTYKS